MRTYSAQDVDGVAALEGQLVGEVSRAVPQPLIVIGIVRALIDWGDRERDGKGEHKHGHLSSKDGV